jgi:protocatechuate 3,4-dioxygenase, alpha subunit
MTKPLPSTPGQTAGPFFGLSLPYGGGPQLVPPGDPRAVRLHGHVLDGAGDPVPDALLELWQPDPDGTVLRRPGSLHRDGWTFTGWGRAATDAAGQWAFSTLAPGATRPGAAPFFALTVFARGLLDRLWTRIYLPGDDTVLAADPLLASLPPERRGTLVATADADGFAVDIVLQGPNETVFLEANR